MNYIKRTKKLNYMN